MDRIRIVGGNPLNGTIPISGAKNAALPLMIASLLTDRTVTLENLPRLADVSLLVRSCPIMASTIPSTARRQGEDPDSGQTVHMTAREIVDTTAPYDLVSRMRASFWVVAPLLARCGEARVSLPGGCAIGTRPVDLLLNALEHLGASIEIDAGYVVAKAPKGLRGGKINFPKVTVGGTHVALMAAALAHGSTVIHNAAREPEVSISRTASPKWARKIIGAGNPTSRSRASPASSAPSIACCRTASRPAPTRWRSAMTGGDVLLRARRPIFCRPRLTR